VQVRAAGADRGPEERHHGLAGEREQLHGPAGAPGGPHREPGAHVPVRNQRLEALQRVSGGRKVQGSGEMGNTRFIFPPGFVLTGTC